jgi:hypothetical protein
VLDGDHLFDGLFQIELGTDLAELAGVNLGKVEQVVDKETHHVSGTVRDFVACLNHLYNLMNLLLHLFHL